MPAVKHLPVRLSLITLMITAGGCGHGSTLTVSGTVMLDGRPTAAEVVIEPLGASGDPIGRPVTVQAQQNGRFTAGIASESVSLPCRIVLRIPRGPGGRPSALDYSVPPDKVVTLHRELQSNTAFTFLITQ